MHTKILFFSIFLLSLSTFHAQNQKLRIAGELISINKDDKKVNAIEMVNVKYKVLEIIDGTYEKDTISFYIHTPSIPKSKRVQLSLSKYENGEYAFLLSSKIHYKENTKFYAFVGEKILLKPFTPESQKGSIFRDHVFKAKYRVIENVYGSYPNETIEFEVYDHYGEPKFSAYNQVLLYVVEGENGKLYHEKYQFSPVYKTTNNRWAGPYAKKDYKHRYNLNTKIKPEKINFLEEVKYPSL